MPVTSMRSSHTPSDTLALRAVPRRGVSRRESANGRRHAARLVPHARAWRTRRAGAVVRARRAMVTQLPTGMQGPSVGSLGRWRSGLGAGTYSCEMRKARPWRPVKVCAATAGVDSQVGHSSSAPRFPAQRPRTLAMMASASPQCVRQPAQLYTLAAAVRGGGRRRKDTTPSFPARRAAPATPQLNQHFGRRRLEGLPRGRRAAAEHQREQQVAQLAQALP